MLSLLLAMSISVTSSLCKQRIAPYDDDDNNDDDDDDDEGDNDDNDDNDDDDDTR